MKMNPEHLDAYVRGELSCDSARFIEAAIRRDEALQEEVFHQAQMDQALRWVFSHQAEIEGEAMAAAEANPDRSKSEFFECSVAAEEMDVFVDGVMASVGAADEESLTRSVLTELLNEREKASRPGPWRDLAKAAAVAAFAVLVTVMALKSVEVVDEEVVAREVAVEKQRLLARITREDEARWGDKSTVARGGDGGRWLGAGLLHLESGRAEVTFDNGARAIMEGPCYLDIETPQRAYLRRGRVTVEVPPPAIGFVINTPSMNVVDLGTRFGVSVAVNGVSELHVMEGEVEASRNAGRAVPVLLREGLAVRADRRSQSQLQPITYAGEQFALRAGSEVLPPAPTVHYRFDEANGPALEDSGRGFPGGPYEATLLASSAISEGVIAGSSGSSFSAFPSATPRRTAGRVGSGLVFRSGESVSAVLPASLDPLAAHTIALWVKLPPRSKGAAGASIVQLSSTRPGGVEVEAGVAATEPAVWQISCNDDAASGPLGALRVQFGEGFVIGTTDLLDGRWHHVATRYAGGNDGTASGGSGDVATHVRLFVDGRVEPIGGVQRGGVSLKALSKNPSAPSEPLAETVVAGDGTISEQSKKSDRAGSFLILGSGSASSTKSRASFEGSIDEVIVCGEALDAAVIYDMVAEPDLRGAVLFHRLEQ